MYAQMYTPLLHILLQNRSSPRVNYENRGAGAKSLPGMSEMNWPEFAERRTQEGAGVPTSLFLPMKRGASEIRPPIPAPIPS